MDNPELVKLDNGQILCSKCSKTFLLMGTAKVHFSAKHSFRSEMKTKNNLVSSPKKNLGNRPKKNPVGRPRKNPIDGPKKNLVSRPKKNLAERPKRNPVVQPKKDSSVRPKKNPVGRPKKDPSIFRPKKNPNGRGSKSKFSFEFQLKIIEEAKVLKNNTEVGRKYGMSECCVRRWRKNEAEIRSKILKKPDDENIDLNENTENALRKKLPEKKTKPQKITLKISMKIDDSQTAVKKIILENSGDASISENIDQNNTNIEDYSPSKSTVSQNL